METRYYEVDEGTGNLTYVAESADANSQFVSYSHGVYMRNSHGQEILLGQSDLIWRTIGGSIDLYFYRGPTQEKVTKAYQLSATGLHAMQQYFTLGYHQCRWGYANWSQLLDVVDSFKSNGIPLKTIWSDIDYMNQYRDFETGQNTYPKSPWALIAANNLQGTANGRLYIDDGESLTSNTTLWVEFSLTGSTLYASARGQYNSPSPLANVTILGVKSAVSNVTLNGVAISSGWTYNSTNQVLAISGLANATYGGAWSRDLVLEWN